VSAIRVRDASPADGAALRRLAGESGAAGPPGGDVVFVAELDGHHAGYVAVRVDASALVIDQLVVPPADRGRHVGHSLLDWVEGYGTSRRLECVQVSATGVDERAREFYARRGYAASGEALSRELAHM
jgi:ribosomal protein S18 acetylase RimI-like enzyme